MARDWAITIGINSYINLKPLNYAQQDAESICQHFDKELNFEQTYHFSDDSPPITQDYGPELNSRPTYATLRRFLRVRFEKPFLQNGDNLWFFFAGHGIRHEEHDYLMLIDSDPGDVPSTAIPVHYIAERMRQSGADNVIMLIDACRTEGRRTGLGIGQEQQKGVIIIYSCSPHESSYEIEALQQGAFTHTLLEALQQPEKRHCATVSRLDKYLCSEVPKISDQYNKPRQNPYTAIEPIAKASLILVPQYANKDDIALLKKDAYQVSSTNKNLDLAEQLWLRIIDLTLEKDRESIEMLSQIKHRQNNLVLVKRFWPSILLIYLLLVSGTFLGLKKTQKDKIYGSKATVLVADNGNQNDGLIFPSKSPNAIAESFKSELVIKEVLKNISLPNKERQDLGKSLLSTESVQSNLSVELNQENSTITISYQHPDPDFPTLLLNSLLVEANKFSLMDQQSILKTRVIDLHERLPSAAASVNQTEDRIIKFKEETPNADTPRNSIELERLERNRDTSQGLYDDLVQQLQHYDVIESQLTSGLTIVRPPKYFEETVERYSNSTLFFVSLIFSILLIFFGVRLSALRIKHSKIKGDSVLQDNANSKIFSFLNNKR